MSNTIGGDMQMIAHGGSPADLTFDGQKLSAPYIFDTPNNNQANNRIRLTI
jgi:hypothetical protein